MQGAVTKYHLALGYLEAAARLRGARGGTVDGGGVALRALVAAGESVGVGLLGGLVLKTSLFRWFVTPSIRWRIAWKANHCDMDVAGEVLVNRFQ